MDEDEIKLTCHGAYDLILIEQASNLFADYMMTGNHIENVLDAIVSPRSLIKIPYVVLPSETFQNIDVDAIPLKLPQVITPKDIEIYKEVVNNYRTNNNIDLLKKQGKNIAAVVAINLSHVGHYAVLLYQASKDEVLFFDSMQATTCGTSAYSNYFRLLAADLFSLPQERVKHAPGISTELSPQFTGGFIGGDPTYLEHLQEKKMTVSRGNLSDEAMKMLDEQITESQNHFCYMWSIWYMHLVIIGEDPIEVLRALRKYHIDPLIVIKRYIYGLVKILKMKVKSPEKFNEYFPSIWTNSVDHLTQERLTNTYFKRYILEMPSTLRTVDDALAASIRTDLGVTATENSKIPPKIQRLCKKI